MQSVQPPQPAPPEDRETAAVARDEAQQVAAATAEQARTVASTVDQEARQVLDQAAQQVGTVAHEATAQARQVLSGASGEVEAQLESRLHDVVSTARQRADELDALCDGRPEDAGRSLELVREASQRVRRTADRVDDLGVRGMVDEVGDFARRQPLLFLAGAAAAGVVVGRLARAGNEARSESASRPSASTASAPVPTSPSMPMPSAGAATLSPAAPPPSVPAPRPVPGPVGPPPGPAGPPPRVGGQGTAGGWQVG